jgi:hypothetical protein
LVSELCVDLPSLISLVVFRPPLVFTTLSIPLVLS